MTALKLVRKVVGPVKAYPWRPENWLASRFMRTPCARPFSESRPVFGLLMDLGAALRGLTIDNCRTRMFNRRCVPRLPRRERDIAPRQGGISKVLQIATVSVRRGWYGQGCIKLPLARPVAPIGNRL